MLFGCWLLSTHRGRECVSTDYLLLFLLLMMMRWLLEGCVVDVVCVHGVLRTRLLLHQSTLTTIWFVFVC